ncbi:MAG: hypothetical protein ACSLFE_04345 [Gemmatimonadaceae bacterium]
MLLAGEPSYVFFRRDPTATAELESRNAVFGAVVESDGSARTVPAPPINGENVVAVAGMASSDSTWRLIFAELDSISTPPHKAKAFWHGVYDGQRWTSLERLPAPPGMPLQYYNNAELVQHGDTVLWAAIVKVTDMHQGVAIFERNGGTWTYHVASTPFVEEMAITHTRASGFALAALHGDTIPAMAHGSQSLQVSAGSGPTSISLYTRVLGWKPYRSVPAGNTRLLIRNLIQFGAGIDVLSWVAANEHDGDSPFKLRAMAGVLGNGEERTLIIDSRIGRGFATVTLRDGSIFWAIEQLSAGGDPQELRLVQWSADSAAVIWRAPQPFHGQFRAVAHGGSDVIVVGPELAVEEQLLVSLLLRIRLDCPPKQSAD